MLNNLSICRKSLDLHWGYEYYFMRTKSKLVSMKVSKIFWVTRERIFCCDLLQRSQCFCCFKKPTKKVLYSSALWSVAFIREFHLQRKYVSMCRFWKPVFLFSNKHLSTSIGLEPHIRGAIFLKGTAGPGRQRRTTVRLLVCSIPHVWCTILLQRSTWRTLLDTSGGGACAV